MKEFVIYKMIFIFLYFLLALLAIKLEIMNPAWPSFVRGFGFACYVFLICKDVSEIIKKKEKDDDS